MQWSNDYGKNATSMPQSLIYVKEHDFYEFGHFRLEPEARYLTDSRDESHILLTPKSFDLLLLLVQNKNRLVTKEMIFERIWSDRVVEENNLTVRVSELRKVLSEQKRGAKFIETVSGSGYRFIADVRTGVKSHAHLKSPSDLSISLAVLPFVNQNGVDDLAYVAVGITESVINNLSQLRLIKVISRNLAFRFTGNETDFLEVGKQLGVQTILTGRILCVGDQLILSVELIDCGDSSQIWGARFRHQSSDIFETQETVAKEVADGLRLKLIENLSV